MFNNGYNDINFYNSKCSFAVSRDKIYYNKKNDMKEGKRMSYMIMISNYEQTVLVTDSRESMCDGTFKDDRQKIFINNNKDIAIGFIGPIKTVVDDVVYDLPKILSEQIFLGKRVDEALYTKIGDLTIKEALRRNHFTKVLTIFIAKKGGIIQGFDYDISRNSFVFYENNHILFNGDLNKEIAYKIIKPYEESYLEDIKNIEYKAKTSMQKIIKLAEEISEAEETNSTIGGNIQLVII